MPIVDTWDEEKLKEIFNSVNGIIFPGGGQVQSHRFTAEYNYKFANV